MQNRDHLFRFCQHMFCYSLIIRWLYDFVHVFVPTLALIQQEKEYRFEQNKLTSTVLALVNIG